MVVLALAALGLTQVHGQNDEPLDVAKKVFGKERLSTYINSIAHSTVPHQTKKYSDQLNKQKRAKP